jgi:hypothetical protein
MILFFTIHALAYSKVLKFKSENKCMPKSTIITLLMVLIIFVLLFFLVRPYESYREVRNNPGPVTIMAKFENVTGDPGCAKLYTKSIKNGETGQQPVFPALPEGMSAPDDGPYAYQGNVFELTGFTYDWVFTNKITGSERHKKSGRFDIIKWRLLQPYTVWETAGGEDEAPSIEKRYEPIMYVFNSPDYFAGNFKPGNYVDCLANQ